VWASPFPSPSCAGRLGDTVDFKTLSTKVQILEFGQAIGAAGYTSTDGFEACGSPGEVANKPELGNRYTMNQGDVIGNSGGGGFYQWYYPENGKRMVWTNVALTAPDQLRQRVAWALAQILVVGQEGSGKSEAKELWPNFYDIFVRNAFGNYRDILQQVSYNPLMGAYLSYYGNTAKDGSGFPDENYAREVPLLTPTHSALYQTPRPPRSQPEGRPPPSVLLGGAAPLTLTLCPPRR
jgi:hypothetical protein